MTIVRSLFVPQTSEVGGTLVPFAGGLFNAENLCMTDAGRLFVTAGRTVAEIVKASDGRVEQITIPVRVDGLPEPSMVNGIAAHGEFLYAACARIHRGNNPLIPSMLCDVSTVEQTLSGLTRVYSAAFVCSVDSYIVRATLRPEGTEFTHLVARLPGKFLANGLATDDQGAFLYVANSAPALSAGIYKLPTTAPAGDAAATLWCRPGCTPNGVKVRDGVVFYSGNNQTPVPSAVLGKVRINDDGGAGERHDIYRSFFSMFDDFDICDHGFVIAQFADFWRPVWMTRFGAGSFLFLAENGREIGVLGGDDIQHPSAVALSRSGGPLFDAGDIVMTDKGRRRVIRFAPDERWRAWLQGAPAPAALAA